MIVEKAIFKLLTHPKKEAQKQTIINRTCSSYLSLSTNPDGKEEPSQIELIDIKLCNDVFS